MALTEIRKDGPLPRCACSEKPRACMCSMEIEKGAYSVCSACQDGYHAPVARWGTPADEDSFEEEKLPEKDGD